MAGPEKPQASPPPSPKEAKKQPDLTPEQRQTREQQATKERNERKIQELESRYRELVKEQNKRQPGEEKDEKLDFSTEINQVAKEIVEAYGFKQNDLVKIKNFNPTTQKWENHEGWRITMIPSGVGGSEEPMRISVLVVNPKDDTDFTNIDLGDLIELNK